MSEGPTAKSVRSSVIISPQQMPNNDSNEALVSSSASEPWHGGRNYEAQLLERTCHCLLSETSSVNLMTLPKHITEQFKIRIQGSYFPQNHFLGKVLPVAKLELAFVLSKECVSFWNDYKIMKDPLQKHTVFIAIQVAKTSYSYDKDELQIRDHSIIT